MSEKINAIIVDDEEPARSNLAMLLRNYCPEIEIVGQADSAENARIVLNENQTDVIFLDISMPVENGFDLLESLKGKNYLYVFVTAYDEYALKALRASAVDYILKPIDIDDLTDAVAKLVRIIKLKNQISSTSEDYTKTLDGLLANSTNENGVHRLCMPSSQGFSMIEVNDIVYLEADSNYTIFHLNSLQKIVVSKSMREFEEILNSRSFFRIHKSSIIHLKYLKSFSRANGFYAIMSEGSSLPISRRRLTEFLEAIESYNK